MVFNARAYVNDCCKTSDYILSLTGNCFGHWSSKYRPKAFYLPVVSETIACAIAILRRQGF